MPDGVDILRARAGVLAAPPPRRHGSGVRHALGSIVCYDAEACRYVTMVMPIHLGVPIQAVTARTEWFGMPGSQSAIPGRRFERSQCDERRADGCGGRSDHGGATSRSASGAGSTHRSAGGANGSTSGASSTRRGANGRTSGASSTHRSAGGANGRTSARDSGLTALPRPSGMAMAPLRAGTQRMAVTVSGRSPTRLHRRRSCGKGQPGAAAARARVHRHQPPSPLLCGRLHAAGPAVGATRRDTRIVQHAAGRPVTVPWGVRGGAGWIAC
jgi:hypothetical protein